MSPLFGNLLVTPKALRVERAGIIQGPRRFDLEGAIIQPSQIPGMLEPCSKGFSRIGKENYHGFVLWKFKGLLGPYFLGGMAFGGVVHLFIRALFLAGDGIGGWST